MDSVKNIERIESQIAKLQNELQFYKSYEFLKNIANTDVCPLPEYMRQYHDNKTELPVFTEAQLYDWMNFSKPSVYQLIKDAIDICKLREYNPKWFSKARWHAKFIDNYMNEQNKNY